MNEKWQTVAESIPPHTPYGWVSVRRSFYDAIMAANVELMAACKLALSGTTNPLIEPKLREVIEKWNAHD